MPDLLNQQSAGAYAILISFAWGATNQHLANYTSWSDAITVDGLTYSTGVAGGPNIETRIEVTSATQTGKAADEPWSVIMPLVTPLTYLARNSAWAPVTCTISEIDPTLTALIPNVMWGGQITKVYKNPKGYAGMLKFDVSGPRVRFKYPLGVESKTGCSRTFGDRYCGYNLAAATQTATITSVAGRFVSAPSLVIPTGMPANYYSSGTVTVDGLSIAITDGSAGVSALRTLQFPPPEWIGATASFTPGCDKSFPRCGVYGNTGRFFGIGLPKPTDAPFLGPR